MRLTLTLIALLAVGATCARAGQYETYAFGDSQAEACEQVQSELRDQAILKCRMDGSAFDKADYGDCRTENSGRGRYKAVRAVVFTCRDP